MAELPPTPNPPANTDGGVGEKEAGGELKSDEIFEVILLSIRLHSLNVSPKGGWLPPANRFILVAAPPRWSSSRERVPRE